MSNGVSAEPGKTNAQFEWLILETEEKLKSSILSENMYAVGPIPWLYILRGGLLI